LKYDMIIWDWNGTLLDDDFLTYDIAQRMLAENGLPPLKSEEHYRELFGFPVRDYYLRMGYDFSDVSYEEVSDRFIELYNAEMHTCSLREGIRDAVDAIGSAGIRQVILSATQDEMLQWQTALYGLEDCFECRLGLSDHYAHSKAQLARDFLERESIAPNKTLFIGDTVHDFEVSSAIGCDCVLLTGGHQNPDRLQSAGVPVLGSPKELLSYIGIQGLCPKAASRTQILITI